MSSSDVLKKEDTLDILRLMDDIGLPGDLCLIVKIMDFGNFSGHGHKTEKTLCFVRLCGSLKK